MDESVKWPDAGCQATMDVPVAVGGRGPDGEAYSKDSTLWVMMTALYDLTVMRSRAPDFNHSSYSNSNAWVKNLDATIEATCAAISAHVGKKV